MIKYVQSDKSRVFVEPDMQFIACSSANLLQMGSRDLVYVSSGEINQGHFENKT